MSSNIQNLPDQIDLFVPGRLCLFGEHSDWAGGYRRIDSSIRKGYCLIVGTDQGIYAKARRLDGKMSIRTTLPDGRELGPYEMPMEAAKLLSVAEEGGFYSYSAGVTHFVQCHYRVDGLEIHTYKMDLPIRRGLSSSAANNVLLARAFNLLYDLKLTKRGEMEIAYQGEILTPSRCGRMDQACAYGSTPVFLTFDGERMDVDELHPPSPIFLVVASLNAGKDTQKILADLNACYPRAGGKTGEDVRYYLGPVNQDILSRAKRALEAGNASELGLLMTEAQALFDRFVAPACIEELRSPVLHAILSKKELLPLVYGGKGVGSQGDGCVQFVARGNAEQKKLIKKLTDLGLEPYPLTIRSSAKPLVKGKKKSARLADARPATKLE